MAIPLDQVKSGPAPSQEGGAPPVSNDDIELAFRMGVKMMSEGNGIQVIEKSIAESKDPAMVIGQFLAQIMMILVQKLHEEMDVDPRIFLAKDGWLTMMLDYIETKLGYPEEFSDEVFAQVVEVIKAAAQSPQGGPPQQGAPQPDPAAMGGM